MDKPISSTHSFMWLLWLFNMKTWQTHVLLACRARFTMLQDEIPQTTEIWRQFVLEKEPTERLLHFLAKTNGERDGGERKSAGRIVPAIQLCACHSIAYQKCVFDYIRSGLQSRNRLFWRHFTNTSEIMSVIDAPQFQLFYQTLYYRAW